ncbi:thiamine pyrophosphokinase [Paragonimus westermani]|uniref:Thiamine pyrophosphokinase n=1 Tax=Paragonimus westermani TaxID=34504 RepID=A0A5J4NJA1_9TREM|nr:thiamine pyrophosphokinase [Paragonimus westermani]
MARIHTPLSVLSPTFPIAFVDGFANLMFSRPDRENFLPQFVTGDFDSISNDALEYYRSKNSVQVIETPDQIATDFTKCIRIINEFIQKEPVRPNLFVI